ALWRSARTRSRGCAARRAPAHPLPSRAPLGSAQPPHHPDRESVGLAFGVGPEQVVAHLVVHHRDPHPLLVIDTAALPVLGMDEMDASVLESLARGFPPIEIFVPFDGRTFDIVVAAEVGNRAT